uniref:BURP domain-containing protein 2 n=1 Tax=Populus davidiana x Populus alba var. pyramidalis TaxID=1550601 RepID=A0A6M8PLV9_9ROSI|nr:BURP domain-containing protein 2 [Populus davidiana x Populus alba var. pyramidalis]
MSPAISGAPFLIFFLTLSLHISFSTAVRLPTKVPSFLQGDNSPPTEKYWFSRLPNTPLPKALRDTLQPGYYPSVIRDFANGEKISVDAREKYGKNYNGAESVDARQKYGKNYNGADSVDARQKYGKNYNGAESVDARQKYGKNYNGADSVDARQKYGKNYNGADNHKKAAKSALPDTTIFYLYNDLHPGKKMKLLFTNSGTKVSFLPRRVAESIPFSSDKFPEILKYFSLQVNSKEAEIISEEIGYCESPNLEGEEKYCAASLESLIDFNVARLGQNVEVLSTEQGKKQEYTVSAKAEMRGEHKASVCHKIRYPYAVHYCHVIEDTEVYVVPLIAADGAEVEAVTVCHLNTSAWSPDHMAFEVLNIKPGPAVCHFLATDTLVWVPKKDQDMTP